MGRAQREGQLLEVTRAHGGGEEARARLQQQQTQKLRDMQSHFERHQEEVIRMLLDKVADVQLIVPGARKTKQMQK